VRTTQIHKIRWKDGTSAAEKATTFCW